MNRHPEGEPPIASTDSRLTREHGHAFKNIFSIILANAEMVAEDPGANGQQVRRRLARIVEACRRGEELVHHIRNPGSPPPMRSPDRIGKATSGAPPASKRVLVVDDEQDIVEIVSRYLKKEGFAVQGMTDSRLALESLRADPLAFDLLLTDFDMPFLSGATLCKNVLALRSDLPVLMITGYDRHVSGAQLVELGVGELLTKPLDRQALLTAIRRLLPS